MIGALAGTGLAAAFVAGWSQVKNIFSYVSSFAMVTAEIDSDASRSIIHNLRYHDWSPVPGGKLFYRTDWLFFGAVGKSYQVPFRLPPNKGIYRKGWRLLFVNLDTNGTSTLTFIRGTVDMDAFVKEALERYNVQTERPSRYHVRRIFGREKGAWANSGRDDSITTHGSSGSSSSPALNTTVMPTLFPALDKSFAYDSSLWTYTKRDDAFEHLYFGPEVLKYIEQASRWLDREKWHQEKRVPWRRGWLIYGPPGTGKTSLAKATARKLRIPIYLFQLSTLSDQELVEKWNSMDTPCVALLEDFDNVFHLRENVTDNKSLTFDCLLNVISGVSARDGVFLMVTTNHIEKIDPAMGVTPAGSSGVSTRPGRIDTTILVGHMNETNRKRMASRILGDWPDGAANLVRSHVEVTPAQFEEICVQYAYARLAEEDAIAAEQTALQKGT